MTEKYYKILGVDRKSSLAQIKKLLGKKLNSYIPM
jgi:DnaJ-class molecular chaperone